MTRSTASIVACIAVLTTVSRLQATLITLNIDPIYGSAENTGATAMIGLDFLKGGNNDTLVVTIENTTPSSIGSKLTAVGLEWPAILALPASFAPGGTSVYFDELDFDVDVSPNGLNAPDGYDIMITSDHSFEGGNPQKAPGAGEKQIIKLSLGNTGLTAVEFQSILTAWYTGLGGDIAIARFQAVNGSLSDKVVTHNPEPATLLLFGLSQLVLQSLRRRRDRI
jgi:hypothetical protein